MKKKLLVGLGLVLASIGILGGCGKASVNEGVKTNIIFGAAPGPYGDLVRDAIQPALEKKGYTVEIKEFSDYVKPNLALANGEIDVNVFQHQVYLDNFAKEHDLKISSIINIPTAALGIYSNKLTNLADLKEGSTFAIPNDVTNLKRALKQAQEAGILKIDEAADATTFSEKNVTENPYKLKITPIEAAQLPRSLDSVDLAAINGNYAIAAGIDLKKALYTEQLTEEYKNVIAVKDADLEAPFVKDLLEIVESEEFQKIIESDDYVYQAFQKPEWYQTKWGK